MGAFYGSVQVRTEDREKVKQAAEEIARARGVKCLLGPLLRGWVGVYPENNGQDDTFGEEIAHRVNADVLHLLVHDDDVMAYWFWRSGELVDSYWSKPGYFGEDQREEQDRMAGRPETFSHLLPNGVEPMRELLRRDQYFVFEGERLQQFARLLKMDNATTAYEYIKQGETDDLIGWKNFDELPADEIAAEKQSAQVRRNQIAALKKHLKSAGLLLAEVVRKKDWPRACAADDGFAVVWSTHPGSGVKPTLDLYTSPWKEPQAVPVDLTPQVNRLTSNRSGSCLAAALGDRVIVWSTGQDRLLRDVPESDWAIVVALSDDGRLLARSSRNEVVITDVETGARLETLQGEEADEMAFHPSGKFLVAAVRGLLGVVELSQQAEERSRKLMVGGARASLSEYNRQQLQGVSPEELEEREHAQVESTIEQIERLARASGRSVPEEQMYRIREELEKSADRTVAEYRAHLSGNSPAEWVSAERPSALKFSRDGQWLYCGTDKGFRIYSWATIAATKDEGSLFSNWQYDVDKTSPYGGSTGYIYAIAEEVNGTGVLFGGLTGQLFRMDLKTGDVQLLLTMPEQASILQLIMSRDGQALGIAAKPNPPDRLARRRDDRGIWTIWSYPKLLEHPEIGA